MKIINELVESLSDNEVPLSSVLLRTKILAHRLGEATLKKWLANEMNGYTNAADIPDYRNISGIILVNATDGFTTRWSNQPVPLGHLDRDLSESLTRRKMAQSVAFIEGTSETDEDSLMMHLPQDICPFLSKGLGKGIFVESAHLSITRVQFVAILNKIRSRLLDFILEMSDQFQTEDISSETNGISKQEIIKNIFNNALLGDNATIIIGDHNSQQVNNVKLQNDFEQLKKTLKNAQVSDDDIHHLEGAIENDKGKLDHDKQVYGPNVKEWLKKMYGKAIDASWQIEIGVAGSLLATALNSFYGWFP